jgi:CDP-ribitol ribitolphosphotransferase
MPTAAPVVTLARTSAIKLARVVGGTRHQANRVVLATSTNTHLEGNLAFIAAEMATREPPLPYVVLAYRKWAGIRRLLGEMRAAYYIGASRLFIVDRDFYPLVVVGARSGSTTVQVWHACGAFKKFGLSVPERRTRSRRRSREPANLNHNYDVFVASSRVTAECYAEAFGQPLDKFVWDIGIPRTDLFFSDWLAAAESIKRRLRIPPGRKVILYAPTFRGSVASARSPQDLDLQTLHRVLGRDHVVLLRPHPHAKPTPIGPELDGFVIDVSDYPEVNELMLVSDILLTDYSSVIFEFALLERPIAFFAPDHEEYAAERGFYFDYRREGPGPVFVTTQELADYLRAGQFDLEVVRRFRDRWFHIADGHSSARFVDQIVLPALAGGGQPRSVNRA